MASGFLVSYGGYPYALSSLFPDNGLASLAAALISEGHSCCILDFNTAHLVGRIVRQAPRERLAVLYRTLRASPEMLRADDLLAVNGAIEQQAQRVAAELAREVVARCKREHVDFVGFKLWSGDGFEASQQMAKAIREQCPGVKLFAGGPAVHYCGDLVLEEAPVFDAVIDGDGEEAIVELARYVEGRRKLAGIPNLLLPGGSRSPSAYSRLSALPLPKYSKEVYPSLWTGEKLKLFCLDESRGCPMKCAFCINWRIEGSVWRTRSAAQVVEEVSALRDELGARAFRMAGTYTHPALLRDVCEALIVQKMDVKFGLFLNAGVVDSDLVELLRRAGCYGVFFGVESGSDEILRVSMNKPVRSERVRQGLTAVRNAGLLTVGSFIFPAPFESIESEAETRRLVEEVFAGHANTGVIVTLPGLIPRTQWWHEREQFGFELLVDERVYRRTLLHYKIRHILPPTLWEALPYRLCGQDYSAIVRRTAAMQRWVEGESKCANIPEHDAFIGVALGRPAAAFRDELRQLLFVGDARGLQEVVDRANGVLCRG